MMFPLDYVPFDVKDRIQLHYYLKDHLGNIMVTFDDRNYDGMIDPLATGTQSEILGRQHYYSFGERGCASHTKWLVAEVKRSVCPADRHGRSRSDSKVITLHAKTHEVLMRKDMDDSYSNHHNVTVNLYQRYGIPPTGYDQQRFRYNGKEMHKGSRLLDYGFRYYSAEIGRFTGVDPVADQYPHVTVYNYAENEPIAHIDLWGLQKRLAVTTVGKNSTGQTFTIAKYTRIMPDASSHDHIFSVYANPGKYGSRGSLEVIHNVETGATLEKFSISLKDRILNMVDGEAGRTEVNGGIQFSLTNGQGKETRFSENAEIGESLDELMGAFGAAKGVGNIGRGTTIGHAFNRLSDAFSIGKDVNVMGSRNFMKVCTVCKDTLELDAPKAHHTDFDTIKIE